MRCTKYQIFNKIILFIKKSPLRILKFKRPKWKKLQLLIQKLRLKATKNRKKKFLFALNFKVNFKSWSRIKSYYKEGLQLKNSVHINFNKGISSKYFKKLILKKNVLSKIELITEVVAQPIFNLNILLCKLNFFSSITEVKQYIKNKNVLVNNNYISESTLLKQGDIISFRQQANIFPIFFNKKLENDFLYSFIEIDYYTKTIIILKDSSHFSTEDLSLITNEYFNIAKFLDYIKTQ